MNAAELSRAAAALPLTVDNLRALLVIAERFAEAMHREGGVIGADLVQGAVLDGFAACDAIEPITLEMRSEWELDKQMNERREYA